MKQFIATSALLILAACSSMQPQQASLYQANLLQECDDALPELNGNTGSEIAPLMIQWAAQYHECRLRHNGLVDAVKQK